jgi:ATP-binding cassette subfamily B protein
VSKREFTAANLYHYNHENAVKWLLSHIWRHKIFVFASISCWIVVHLLYSYAPVLVGRAVEAVTQGDAALLTSLALLVLVVLTLEGLIGLIGSLSVETLAQRLEASTREELYSSLLGKSQAFHDRQRVGDIMALVTDDVVQLNVMMNPGILFIFETILGILIPLTFIGFIRLELLLVPVVFVVSYVVTLKFYSAELYPVAAKQRGQFGKMNAVLEESISGIEIVKASAQESFERHKFRRNARLFRDFFVRQGFIEARYLPLLFYGIATGLAFLHALILNQQGMLTIAEIIGFMGLFNLLRFPTFISVFSFSLVGLGIAGADRVLRVINTETDLDQNKGGFAAPMKGSIVLENVWFGQRDNALLKDVSFQIEPGQTVAIVGQTGSGKTSLTQLINRTYDVAQGRVLIDGVDVREWDLNALRSQISKIEQDVFLFSRTIAENIAFGAPNATQEQIEQAAREAQAHDFIMSFTDGYQTKVGERGVTLSGGQRQRIALARAFLSDPRVLILDDSTSAIDSATEDEIQKAIRRAQHGRTTLLITHRLSQIRWADMILVLDGGRVVACGGHDDLLRQSPHYRRIFARYEVVLPPLETQPA